MPVKAAWWMLVLHLLPFSWFWWLLAGTHDEVSGGIPVGIIFNGGTLMMFSRACGLTIS